jgi:hypothetical protein
VFVKLQLRRHRNTVLSNIILTKHRNQRFAIIIIERLPRYAAEPDFLVVCTESCEEGR